MILWVLVALLCGILAGTFTGLFPGIHINLVSAGLLALIAAGRFSGVAPLTFAVFVVAMAVTHTFLDFIPSVFLGAPEEDSFLAVLPGHELLRLGRGHEAVVYTLYGSLAALPVILTFTFVFVFALDWFYDIFSLIIPYVLVFVSVYLILREEEIVDALVVFFMAGFVGLFAFHLPVREPLLPLLGGLFGVSGLIVSVRSKVRLPRQRVRPLRKIRMPFAEFWRGSLAAGLVAPFFSFLPGMGSGHAAVVASEFSGRMGESKRYFLFLVGAINTIVMALSFVTVFAIGKSRTGAAAAVYSLLGEFSLSILSGLIVVVFVSGFVAFFLGVRLSKFFSRKIARFDYGKISLGVIGLLFVMTLVLSNIYGVLVLVTATAVGVFAILSRVRRINLMGCLLLPTVLYYLVG